MSMPEMSRVSLHTLKAVYLRKLELTPGTDASEFTPENLMFSFCYRTFCSINADKLAS